MRRALLPRAAAAAAAAAAAVHMLLPLLCCRRRRRRRRCRCTYRENRANASEANRLADLRRLRVLQHEHQLAVVAAQFVGIHDFVPAANLEDAGE